MKCDETPANARIVKHDAETIIFPRIKKVICHSMHTATMRKNKWRPPCKSWRLCEAAADSQVRTVRTIIDPEAGLEPINDVLVSVETGESI